ncbi:MAG: hypothetical protein V3U98_10835, partial [Acidobacteriota bacterium]
MIYLASILAYLAALVIMAVVLSRRVRAQDDFMVAGRRLGIGVMVGTLLATWIGTGSLMGAAGLAYRDGLAALWFSASAWIGIIVLYFVAARARRQAASHRSPAAWSPRWAGSSGAARRCAPLSIRHWRRRCCSWWASASS